MRVPTRRIWAALLWDDHQELPPTVLHHLQGAAAALPLHRLPHVSPCSVPIPMAPSTGSGFSPQGWGAFIKYCNQLNYLCVEVSVGDFWLWLFQVGQNHIVWKHLISVLCFWGSNHFSFTTYRLLLKISLLGTLCFWQAVYLPPLLWRLVFGYIVLSWWSASHSWEDSSQPSQAFRGPPEQQHLERGQQLMSLLRGITE